MGNEQPRRVVKRGSSDSSSSGKARMTAKQKNRLIEEASSSSIIRQMVEETTLRSEDTGIDAMDLCEPPQPEKKTLCFELMKLPAEIRNEIYRACLTRPFNILLSRKEQPLPEPNAADADGAADSPSASTDTEEDDDGAELSGSRTGESNSGMPQILRSNASTSTAPAGVSTPSTNQSQATGNQHGPWATRSIRPLRVLTRPSSTVTPSANATAGATAGVVFRRSTSRTTRPAGRPVKKETPRPPRPQDVDPLVVSLLRVSKTVYQEARSILYSENLFTLDIDTALPTLATLHQRSRKFIKHAELEIPSYNEILERFQETVRLSLRYCWGLKTFVIHMPFTLPGADGSGTTGNTTVYANGFDILRWLPKQCEVVLKGNICAEIEAVVSKNANLAKTLDEREYASRQLDPTDKHAGVAKLKLVECEEVGGGAW